MATFPGSPPNPLGLKVELLLGGSWTDITAYVQHRSDLQITNMGRADESSSISPCQLQISLKNDGRFTPKNSAGAYYPNIIRNTQVRVSVNATSITSVAYSGSRFYGEISSWPPASDISGRDTYVTITASGIWRRISQSQTTIGSAFTRYVRLLTGANVPVAYWAMEDGASLPGAGTFSFVPMIGANSASSAGTLSLSADSTSFPGSDALPQFNGARITANVSGSSPSGGFAVWTVLSVPAAGDSTASTFSGGGEFCKITTGGTVATIHISLHQNSQLAVTGNNASGTQLFTGTITTKVNGTPVLVSYEQTAGAYALKIIKPGATSVLDQVTGSGFSWTLGAVTIVQLNDQGRLADSTGGQLAVFNVSTNAVTSAAPALGGRPGEFAVDRFNRLCGEFGIAAEVIGSASAAMGPQVDDTLANILQSIESTDGGLLFESRGQFGLGYRTLGSLQNQSVAATLNYTAGQLGAPPAPTYDDQLLANQVTAVNYDGYTALAQLTSGALSVAAVPNGVGVYAPTQLTTNASSHSQVNAVAQQRMFIGTVDDVRYPQVAVNMARAQAASLFATVPGLRIGDYFQLTNLPATLGGSSTSKQLAWGYSEAIGHNSWVITFNAIPELPFETTFSPGTYSVTQAPAAGVAQGSAVGSTVSASQIGAGAVLPGTISARGIGGMTSFISASTPYDWSFAVSGTPADVTYFTATEDQTLPIAVGDTFVNTGGLGGPFTVTSVDPPSGGNVNVHFTPDASSVMSTGTVQGGKEGDTWVNTSGGNQVNIWHNGAWSPVSWNAASVLTASSITASLIAAGTVVAGIVNGTLISGAQFQAYGTNGEILVYSGTPASGNLIGSWSGAAGTDTVTPTPNAYPAGLAVEQGGLVLYNQGSPPSAVSGASSFYSSSAGRPRYLAQTGADSIIERSQVNVSQFTPSGGNTIAAQISAQLAYQAGEGLTSSEYEIEIDSIISGPTGGSGTGPTLTFGLAVDGTVLGAQFSLGGVMFNNTSSLKFVFTGRFRMAVIGAGAGGTVIMAAEATVWDQAINLGNQTAILGGNINASSGGTTKSFDTTSAHTLQVMSSWGSTTYTGHGITTYRTRLTRRD